MQIKIDRQSDAIVVTLTGRLDTNTSAELDKELVSTDPKCDLVLDFCGLEYMSSAGLRLLVAYDKRQKENGKTLVVKNANAVIKEIFGLTGFNKVLTIR